MTRPEPADPIVVGHLVSGTRMTATPADIREAVRILTQRGHTAQTIANRIGVTERTVQRHRAALRGTTT